MIEGGNDSAQIIERRGPRGVRPPFRVLQVGDRFDPAVTHIWENGADRSLRPRSRRDEDSAVDRSGKHWSAVVVEMVADQFDAPRGPGNPACRPSVTKRSRPRGRYTLGNLCRDLDHRRSCATL